jgi:hypothetical protein
MPSSIDTPARESRMDKLKARAQAKQKWLEQALAAPTTSPRHAAQRAAWIKRALDVVRRAQSAIKAQTQRVDAYAQHLSALEMTLMSAAEPKGKAGNPATASKRE